MATNKLWNWLFPVLSVLIFGSLMWALLREIPSVSIAIATGVLAFSLLVVVMFMTTRPKVIEHKHGLTNMYAIHGTLAIVLTLVSLLHFLLMFDGFGGLAEGAFVSWSGFIGILGFLLATITGIFFLSTTFISNSKKLMQFKEQKANREIMLWVHRFVAISAVAVYLHMISFGFIRENTLFFTLANIYAFIGIGGYFIYKLYIQFLPKYDIVNHWKPTPTLHAIELKPRNGKVMKYNPGQFVFIRIKSEKLPFEAHPFSITSDHNPNSDTIELMIKESGDFTDQLDKLEKGASATLEGPFGTLLDKETQVSNEPMVLLGGGIGMTPMLSIARDEHRRGSQRHIDMVWALAYGQDRMLDEEMAAMQAQNPNFRFHYIFSDEEVEGYDHGFVDANYLEKIGANQAYDNGKFFICGPPPMMAAVENVLTDNQVADDQIHIEYFSF